MEEVLRLNPGDELTCLAMWDKLKEIVGKVPKDPNFGEALKTLGRLLDDTNHPLVNEKAKDVLKELVQSCPHTRQQDIACPLWFFGCTSAQSIKTGIQDAFPAIF